MKLVGVLCVLVSVTQCELLAGGWRDVKPTEDDVSVNTISPVLFTSSIMQSSYTVKQFFLMHLRNGSIIYLFALTKLSLLLHTRLVVFSCIKR